MTVAESVQQIRDPGSLTFVRGPPGFLSPSLRYGDVLSSQERDVVVSLLTVERLQSYLIASNGDIEEALNLYRWNAEISSALFSVLSDVEIAFRNAIDQRMQYFNVTLGNEGSWFDSHSVIISDYRRKQLANARASLVVGGKPVTHSNLVSELGFGFWRSFLTKQYKDTLWRRALRFAFPHSPSRQPEYVFTRVRHLHVLRNRIAHHEPIHNRDIAHDFQICMDVLNAISPVIAEWSNRNSRIPQVLAHRPL